MTNLEQAAAAALATWERDGANYDAFCQRMDALREALAAHRQAGPVSADEAMREARMNAGWGSAQQPEPVAVRPDVLAFLQGAAPLDGVWFGEKPDGERGQFWWRKYLPPAPQQAEPVAESYAVQSAVLIEREACARLCESTTAAWTQHLYNDACMDCAKAIRGQAEPDGASGNPSY